MTTPDQLTVFLAALRSKTGFEVVSCSDLGANPNQLRLLGRIPEDRLGQNMNNWKILMYRLYVIMESRPWKADFSKSYFIKKETKKLVFAWRAIFQGEDLARHFAELVALIQESPVSARTDVAEMPLPGASANRNSTAGGKRGAGPAGKVLVGPLAVAAKMQGG